MSIPAITDISFRAAPAAAPEARQVGLLHGGEQLPEADDDIQHGIGGKQPPHAAVAAPQVLLDAALALDQERIPGLGGGQSVSLSDCSTLLSMLTSNCVSLSDTSHLLIPVVIVTWYSRHRGYQIL